MMPHELPTYFFNVITAIIGGIVIMASSHFTLPFVIATTLGSEADKVPEFYVRL